MAALSFVEWKNMFALACRTLHRVGSLAHPEFQRIGDRIAIEIAAAQSSSLCPRAVDEGPIVPGRGLRRDSVRPAAVAARNAAFRRDDHRSTPVGLVSSNRAGHGYGVRIQTTRTIGHGSTLMPFRRLASSPRASRAAPEIERR